MAAMTEITPEQQTDLIWDYIKGFHAVHLMDIGKTLGLFEAIKNAEDGLTAAALATALDLHAHYVDIWCKTAFAYRLLDADGDGHYRLAPHFDTILVDHRHPRYLAPYVSGSVRFFADDFKRYPDHFRTGAVHSFQAHGEDFSDGIAAMTGGFHAVVARKMLPSVSGLKDNLAAGARVLDMGCGAAGLVMRIAEAYPQTHCVGVDIDPHGITLARRNVAAAGLAERVTIEQTDGGTIGHENEFDVVTLFEVLHEIPLDVRPQVLANCHRALKPGAPLFILDETYPADLADLRAREYGLAVQTAFNELIWGNVVPTADEQDALLASAGFEQVERMQVATYFTVITARKPN